MTSSEQRKRELPYRRIVLAYSASLHILAWLLFMLTSYSRQIFHDYRWQFYLLFALSCLSSLILTLYNKPYLLLLKYVSTLLLAYPMGQDTWIVALLMMSLTVDTALYTPLSLGRYTSCLVLIPFLFFQNSRTAFHIPLAGTPLQDRLFLFFLPLLSGQIAFIMNREGAKKAEQESLIKRLDLASARLIDANLGYQNYAEQVEARTLTEERRRISREIHDTVGYSLTNVRVMLEAGAMQVETKPAETRQLMLRAMEETRRCLEETRRAMGELRERELPDNRGLTAITKLIKTFETSTGMKVNLQYGEVPLPFTEEIDRIIYRTVQEAITNSFRHGMADTIDIMFWEEEGLISLLIRDNGKGAPSVKEGLGLTGMRERLERIGGTVHYGNGPKGFQVRAALPLGRERKSGSP
ncbi:MAG: sensor histidine kinase [Spirochaetales bacterium]|nr:sensor histidine kinase [Spirochaetales bacterium]